MSAGYPGGYGQPGFPGSHAPGQAPFPQQGPNLEPGPASPEGMGTGAKVGIGIAIGCATAILVLLVVMLAAGACTCQACSSCCSQMNDLAQKSREMEERESARINAVGETVHVSTFAVMVSEAQRQESTVVVSLDIENTSSIEEELDPTQFILEDSAGKRYAVDREKARLTMDGVQAGDTIPAQSTRTVRAVFSVAPEAKGLVLQFKTPAPSTYSRRFGLGI